MKILDIAIKDLKQSFRSLFALAFMFGIPLLMTLLFIIYYTTVMVNIFVSLPFK